MNRLTQFTGQLARHSFLLLLAALTLVPFAWMLSTASKPETEVFSDVLHWLPQRWALLDNLRTAFERARCCACWPTA